MNANHHLIVIDAVSIFTRSYKVMTEAEAFKHAVRYIIERHPQPQHTILVWDTFQSGAFRKNISSLYKAKRKEDKDRYDYLLRVRNALAFLGYIQVTTKGNLYEADDVIALFAHNACEDHPIVVVTRDTDMCAVANHYCAVVNENLDQLIFPLNITKPKVILAYKALVGDTSDGITGVPRLGKVAFKRLLENFGDEGAEYILDCITTNNKKAIQEEAEIHTDQGYLAKIVQHWADAVISWRLASFCEGVQTEVKFDVRLPITEEDTAVINKFHQRGIGYEEIQDFFTQYETVGEEGIDDVKKLLGHLLM